jgi:hypothetical protein
MTGTVDGGARGRLFDVKVRTA